MHMRTQPSSNTLALALVAAVSLLGARTAAAQTATTGAVQGVVTDAATGEPIAGVTVLVSSQALQGTQSAITDDRGQYKITNLPPGLYQVDFYFADLTVRRPGVPVSLNKTTPGFVALDMSDAGGEIIVIEGLPP